MFTNIIKNNQALKLNGKISNNMPSEKLDYQKFDPFTINKHINIVTLQFKLANSLKIHLVFHVSLLKPYHVSTILRIIHKPLPFIEINSE